jgi:hypothetical protein
MEPFVIAWTCVVGMVAAGAWLLWSAKPPPPVLSDYAPTPTVAIQPDGSVYLRPDRQRLGGATVAPRLRKEAGR